MSARDPWEILEDFEAGLAATPVDQDVEKGGFVIVYGGPMALLGIELNRRFIFSVSEGPAPKKGVAANCYRYIRGELVGRYGLEPKARRVWLSDALIVEDRVRQLRQLIAGMHSIDVTPLAPDYTIFASQNAVAARWDVTLTFHYR